MNFLPAWPLDLNNFALFGLLLLVGLLGGSFAARTKYLPRITGFILIGLLLGPSGIGLFTSDMLATARVFVDIALGLILFQLGLQLDVRSLRADRSLLITSLLESGLTFLLVFVALLWLNVSTLLAALAATAAISASPAVVFLVARELNAAGPVTERTLNLVALNNIIAFFVFSGILPFLHLNQQADINMILLQPLYQVAVSLLVAFVLCRVGVWIGRQLGRRESAQFALMVGLVIMAVGLSQMFVASELLTLLALGVMIKNLDHEQDLLEVEFGHSGEIFFVILFVYAGANLHLSEMMVVGWVAIAFVLARYLGKLIGLSLAKRFSPLSWRQTFQVSLTLTPMAGLAIGMVEATSHLYSDFSATLTAIVLASVAILETVGPVLTEYALKQSGEVPAGASVDH